MAKQIIFDFDGVLYPSTAASMERILSNISLAVNHKASKVPDQKLLNKLWGLKLEAMANKLTFRLQWTQKEQKRFLQIHREDVNSLPIDREAQALISETLLHLKKQGKELFIVSNRDKTSLVRVAQEIGLDLSLFKLIICCDSLKNPETGFFVYKPNPMLVKHILQLEEGYKLKNFIFVGDSISIDFELARQANLNFIALPSALHNLSEWEEAFKLYPNGFDKQIASSFLEIKDLV